ncbi:MAG: response regulator [Bacteroidota bacterium]|jgi:CheY-like chemotaxis protein
MSQPYSLVVVDDDPFIIQMLGFQLKKLVHIPDISFEYYTNPEEAFEGLVNMLKSNINPVMLITDYQMPEMSGAELIRKSKALHPELSCILLTGYANAIQVDDLVNDEMLDGFISKPWSEEDLTGTILPILENKNLFI